MCSSISNDSHSKRSEQEENATAQKCLSIFCGGKPKSRVTVNSKSTTSIKAFMAGYLFTIFQNLRTYLKFESDNMLKKITAPARIRRIRSDTFKWSVDLHSSRQLNSYMNWLNENGEHRKWMNEYKIFTIKVSRSYKEKMNHIHRLRLAVRRGINNSR